MFENDYPLAWSIYLLGALGGLLVWWRLTRWMWRWLREPLWILGAALLLTPTMVDAERGLHAPAIAITAMDLLFGMGNSVWRAVSDLVLSLLIGLAIYLVFVAVRWFWQRQYLSLEHQEPLDEADTEYYLFAERHRYSPPHPSLESAPSTPRASSRIEPRL